MTTVFATYRVRKDQLEQFDDALRGHWRLLHDSGLVTDEPAIVLARDAEDGPVRMEIFTWRDEAAVDAAHEHEAVMALWGKLESWCEERESGPSVEFPHVTRLA
ncbi:hypothetical protein [Micromonospora sp. NPDC051296]|uniref:hypothetical protein n=1 Tax=Micromonospora sp. NPDC051296 TaxID=3155046 RepID=UPI0034169B7E